MNSREWETTVEDDLSSRWKRMSEEPMEKKKLLPVPMRKRVG